MKTKKVNYSGINASLRVSDDFMKVQLLGDFAKKEYRKIVKKSVKKKGGIGDIYIQSIKKIIMQGGGTGKFSWMYWKRVKGQKKWSLVKPSNRFTRFSNRFSYGNTSNIKLPIHPSSYMARKRRKKPQSGQFALKDTGGILRSFKTSMAGSNQYKTTFNIFSGRANLLKAHEKGIRSKEGKVVRKTIEPAIHEFHKDPQLKKQLYKQGKQLEKEIKNYMSRR